MFFLLRVWGLADLGWIWLGWDAIRGTRLQAVIILHLLRVLSLGSGLPWVVVNEQEAKPPQAGEGLLPQHLPSSISRAPRLLGEGMDSTYSSSRHCKVLGWRGPVPSIHTHFPPSLCFIHTPPHSSLGAP